MNRKINFELVDANILEVEVEHNGLQGGDAGHGGFVRILLKSTNDITVDGKDLERVEIMVRGDSERRNLSEAFRRIHEELEQYQS